MPLLCAPPFVLTGGAAPHNSPRSRITNLPGPAKNRSVRLNWPRGGGGWADFSNAGGAEEGMPWCFGNATNSNPMGVTVRSGVLGLVLVGNHHSPGPISKIMQVFLLIPTCATAQNCADPRRLSRYEPATAYMRHACRTHASHVQHACNIRAACIHSA